jgi:hypothetical protein
MADSSLANIGAWVAKKVPELVGMEEPDLVEFIMGHVRNHAPAGEACSGALHRLLASSLGAAEQLMRGGASVKKGLLMPC